MQLTLSETIRLQEDRVRYLVRLRWSYDGEIYLPLMDAAIEHLQVLMGLRKISKSLGWKM